MSSALQKLTTGTVELHGESVDLTSREGIALVNDLAREEEGAVQMSYVQMKHGLSDTDLADLAQNADLVRAISLARQQRRDNGAAIHDAALVYREKSVHVVGKILLDKMEPSRTRLQADERLDKIIAASGGPDGQERREQVVVNIITSHNTPEGMKTITVGPSKPALPPPEELQPIMIVSRASATDEPQQPNDDPDGAPPTGE